MSMIYIWKTKYSISNYIQFQQTFNFKYHGVYVFMVSNIKSDPIIIHLVNKINE